MAMAMMITQRWWRCDGQKEKILFLSLTHTQEDDKRLKWSILLFLPPKLRSIFQFLTIHVVPLTMTSCFIILVNQTIDNGQKGEKNIFWLHYTVFHLNLQMNLLLYSLLFITDLSHVHTLEQQLHLRLHVLSVYDINICSYYILNPTMFTIPINLFLGFLVSTFIFVKLGIQVNTICKKNLWVINNSRQLGKYLQNGINYKVRQLIHSNSPTIRQEVKVNYYHQE